MGNVPVKLGLKLDGHTFESGSKITGRVYLSVTKEVVQSQGIYLHFTGEEVSTIVYESGSGDHKRRNRQQASNILVNTQVMLMTFQKHHIQQGQYEYPFEWQLPTHLASTMSCYNGDSHCEVRYQLTAGLQQGGSSMSVFSPTDVKSTQTICITGQSTAASVGRPVHLEPEIFPVHSCCRKRGSIQLGLDVNSDLVAPCEDIQVRMTGRNDSIAPIRHLHVCWSETVEWSANERTERQSRILVDAQVATSGFSSWDELRHGTPMHRYGTIEHETTSRRIAKHISLPPEARDTYPGLLIDVRHVLTVSAVTHGCCTTSPETSTIMNVYHNLSHDGVEPLAPTMVTFDEEQPAFATAEVLPQEWSPQEADVVVLPASSATVLPTVATAVASAPPSEEDVMYGETLPSNVDDLIVLQQLLVQRGDQAVEFLHSNVLNDPVMVTRLANLTPPEYVGLLQGLSSHVADIAREVATVMQPNFSCRHVLATLWGLPNPIRFDVLKEIAPMANDLDTEQGMIERELTESELVHFRAAIHVRKVDVKR